MTPTSQHDLFPATAAVEAGTTTGDLEADFQLRLAINNNCTSTASEEVDLIGIRNLQSESDMGAKTESVLKEEDLISFDDVLPTAAQSSASSLVEGTVEQPVAAKKPIKSALLARIMAAQEKAKLDQIKQISASSTSSITQKSTTSLHPPPPPPAFSETMINAEEERQKMMRALNGQTVADDESKQKSKSMLYDSSLSSLKPPPLPPTAPSKSSSMAMSVAPPPLPPTASHSMPSPPSYSSSETLHLPPPAIKNNYFAATSFAPPRMPPPPAFDAIENDLYNIPHVQAPTAPPEIPSAPPSDESLMDNYHGITPMRPPSLPNYSTSRAVQEMDDELFLEFDFDGNKMSAEERHKMMEEQRAIMEQIERQSGENKASETAIRTFTDEQNFHSYANENNTTCNNGVAPGMDVSDMKIDAAELDEQRAIMEDIERRKSGQQQKTPVSTAYHETLQMETQIEEDRELAKRLQLEIEGNMDDSSTNRDGAYPGNRPSISANQRSSWWGSIKSSVGNSAEEKNDGSEGQRRPLRLHGVTTGDENESISNEAPEPEPSKASSRRGLTSMFYRGNDESNDTSSFLVIPNVGDDRD